MESLSFIIGILGNILSLLIFASPIGTFMRIVRNRSTEEFESIPYVCALLNSCMWTYYGINKPGELLIATINGVGAVLEAIYITLFLVYAPKRIRVKTGILVAILDVGFFVAAILITRLVIRGSAGLKVVGFLTAGLNIVMYSSPLAAMKTVINTKSVEYMPFFLSFFIFVNSGVWTIYSVLVRDIFVVVPNSIGFILGAAQLILYAIYKNAKPAKIESKGLEEGLLHHHLSHSPSSSGLPSEPSLHNDNYS